MTSPSSPLYKEVKNRLMRGLAAGEWKPGQTIPSESRLAGRYGVSVGNVLRLSGRPVFSPRSRCRPPALPT